MKNAKSLVEVDLGFVHAFLASLSVIIVSELGDKTFFIAAILAMRNPRITVFAGAMLALGLMTVLSGEFCYGTSFVFARFERQYRGSAVFLSWLMATQSCIKPAETSDL